MISYGYVYLITNDEGKTLAAFYDAQIAVEALERLSCVGRVIRVPLYLSAKDLKDELG